jgi:inner membrane protein involved in colicin E2 resistance
MFLLEYSLLIPVYSKLNFLFFYRSRISLFLEKVLVAKQLWAESWFVCYLRTCLDLTLVQLGSLSVSGKSLSCQLLGIFDEVDPATLCNRSVTVGLRLIVISIVLFFVVFLLVVKFLLPILFLVNFWNLVAFFKWYVSSL